MPSRSYRRRRSRTAGEPLRADPEFRLTDVMGG
ncbi:hypothetical protein HDA44_003647 [Kribbella solani]|uniref:Uncharacterized protein n=1 Tax=Kribbella solani TaxID=236067 RepID=A0A841DU68_9ACTN|nr:hypothetical protein [Kribbella solani]